MNSVQNSILNRNKSRKEYIKFLDTKKDILHALGLGVQVPTKGSLDQRWDLIHSQIMELTPEKKKIFDQIESLYNNEKGEREEVSKQAKEEEKVKQDGRDKAGEEQRRQKEEKLRELEKMIEDQRKAKEEQIAAQNKVNGGGGNKIIPAPPAAIDLVDVNMDIDNMPDCRLKYQIIVKRAKQGMGRFKDAQFPADNSSIGDGVLNSGAFNPDDIKWERMGEKKNGGYSIF